MKNKFHLGLLLLLIAFFFSSLAGNAQTDYKFDHLTVDDGLSSNRIWCILRDQKDFLWISTDLGLDKYNSYEVKKYRFDEKQAGTISSDNVISIYEDRNKNLWFGTSNGLNLYDPVKDNFKVFKTFLPIKTVSTATGLAALLRIKKAPFGLFLMLAASTNGFPKLKLSFDIPTQI